MDLRQWGELWSKTKPGMQGPVNHIMNLGLYVQAMGSPWSGHWWSHLNVNSSLWLRCGEQTGGHCLSVRPGKGAAGNVQGRHRLWTRAWWWGSSWKRCSLPRLPRGRNSSVSFLKIKPDLPPTDHSVVRKWQFGAGFCLFVLVPSPSPPPRPLQCWHRKDGRRVRGCSHCLQSISVWEDLVGTVSIAGF